MGMNVIRHGSRKKEYKYKFTIGGELSRPFIPDRAGEIFAIESDNISNYTFNNLNISLPFTFKKGDQFPISITKLDPNQAASLNLITRVGLDEINEIFVPDFTAYSNRFLYLLVDNSQVLKLDTDLLLNAFYNGDGIWSNNAIVSTIDLPVLPTGFLWQHIIHTDNRIYILGGNDNTTTVIKVLLAYLDENDNVFNADGIANSFSDIFNLNARYGGIGNAVYDFIHNYLYIIPQGGQNGGIAICYSITGNNIVGYMSFSTPAQIALGWGAAKGRRIYYNDIDDRIELGITAVKGYPEIPQPITYLGDPASLTESTIFNRKSGLVVRQIYNGFIRLRFYDSNFVNKYDLSNGAIAGNIPLNGVISYAPINDQLLFYVGRTTPVVGYMEAQMNPRHGYVYPPMIKEGQKGFYFIECTDRNNLFFSIDNLGSSPTRLFVFEPNLPQQIINTRYMDIPHLVNSLCVNRRM